MSTFSQESLAMTNIMCFISNVKENADALPKQHDVLQKSDDSFRIFFDRAAVPTVVQGPDGRILQSNAAYREFFGYTEKELQSLNVLDITYPDDRAETNRARQQLLENDLSRFHFQKRSLFFDS